MSCRDVGADNYGQMRRSHECILMHAVLWQQPHNKGVGEDAYPSLIEKAAALGYWLVRNHGDTQRRFAFRSYAVPHPTR